jgi:proline iminopeptidase
MTSALRSQADDESMLDPSMLGVGDGHSLHGEVSGNPEGKPAVVLHGGPGSGSTP